MEESYEAESFKNILIDKGYTNDFVITVYYFGKLEDSINSFLKDNESILNIAHGMVQLSTYLRANDQDQSSIRCDMWAGLHNGRFTVDRTEIILKNSLGKIMDHAVVDVTIDTIPTVEEAIALVCDENQKKISIRNGRRIM